MLTKDIIVESFLIPFNPDASRGVTSAQSIRAPNTHTKSYTKEAKRKATNFPK